MLKTIIFIVLAAAIIYLVVQYLPKADDNALPAEEENNEEAVLEEETMAEEEVETNNETTTMETQKFDNGLEITTLREGSGAEAQVGSTVAVHYVGTLTDGTKFDSSRDRNQPFNVTLGQNRVIPGWEQGLLGIKAGEMRKLVIPPELGYGSQPNGPIPANSTLVFEIEALAIQ